MKKGKMRMSGRRVLAFLLVLAMCVTLLPMTVFARDYITVNYVVNGVTLRTDRLPTGTYIQVGNSVPYVSSLIAGTAYADYDYGTVTKIECRPLQYFPPSALTLREGQSIEHSKNYGTHTITYTTSKWEKHGSSSTTNPGTSTQPGTSGGSGSYFLQVVYVNKAKTNYTFGPKIASSTTLRSWYYYNRPQPEPDGYELKGWQSSRYHGTNNFLGNWWAIWGNSTTALMTSAQYNESVVLSSGQGVYLIYQATADEPKPVYGYELNYDYNGGTLNGNTEWRETALNLEGAANATHTFYEQVSKRPSREGYTFLGWTYSGNGTFTVSNGQINMTGKDGSTVSGTLTAQWQINANAKATLTYNANGGTNPPAAVTVTPGTGVSVAGQGSMTNGNRTFLGWSTNQNATTADILPEDTLRLDEDTTLYAVWKTPQRITYRVGHIYYDENFKTRIGTGDPTFGTCIEGETVLVKDIPKVLTYNGETYTYYLASMQGNGSKAISSFTPVSGGSDIGYPTTTNWVNLWYKKAPEQATLVVTKTLVNATKAELPDNYGIKVYANNSLVGTLTKSNLTNSGDTDSNTNLKWDKVVSVPKGSTVKLQEVNYKTTDGREPTLSGTNTDDATKSYTRTLLSSISNAKVSLTNTYSEQAVTYSYRLDYKANVGLGETVKVPENQSAMSVSDAEYEFTIPQTEPMRLGYEFIGWSTDENATKAEYQPGAKIKLTGNPGAWKFQTLYAVWAEQHTFALTYDANGDGATIDGKNAAQTRSTTSIRESDYFIVDKTLAPQRTGYTFLGWATDEKATEANIKPGDRIDLDLETPRKTIYAVWQANGPKLIETPFAIQLSFCYLENGRADIPDNFQLEMEITNENVPDFKLTKTLTKAEATETTNGGPALLWELNEKLPQSFENAAHHDAGQGSAELHGVNTVKIKAVNGEVSGYQFTMRGGGTDPTDARGGAQVRELTFAQAGSTYPHQHSFFNTYVIPHKATHYYYDSVDDYNKGNVGGTVVVESDGTSGKPHLETTQKAWNGITAEKKSYDGKSYIVKDKPESFAVTQATKNFEFKYIRKITVTWQKEDGSQIKSEEIPNGSDVSDDDYPTDQSTTGKWADPVKDENGNITIKWTEPKTYDYKMTYKLDGGKYNDNTADVVKEEKAQTAESYTFDALNPAPVKEGYIFKGWNGSLTVTKDSPNGEVTAVWEPKTYTVKWLDDDEKTVLDSDTFKTGENEPVYDEETPSKDDDDEYKYEFTGWSEPKKDTDGNITYVAQYTKTAIKKFTVTYTDGVDDEVIFEDDVHGNLKEGSATPKFTKTLSRDNYTFVDWSPSVAETVTENVTYVAQWKANTHKVTWVDENGDTIKEITVEDKDTTGVPEGETPTDYTIPEDKEFDKWEEQEPDENGDIVIKLILKDKVVEPPTPVEANYTVEWYEIGKEEPIKTETTRKGEVGTEVSVTDEDKTIEGYTFDEENSENVLSTELEESGTVLKLYFTKNQVNPPEPTETNYTVEWYEIGEDEPIKTDATRKGEVGAEVSATDEDKTIKYYTFDEENENNVTSVELEESGTVLKLYFTANTHKVTWVDEDGTPVKEIEVKDKDTEGVPEGEEPTDYTIPDGKEFGGWGEPETDPETGDVTITVIWKDKEKTYTLSYDANEGTGAPAQQSETTTEDSVTFTVADGEPQREGYTFEGWTENLLARDSLYTAGNEITISEDTTLYAVWAKNAEPEKTHSVTWKDGYTDTPIKTLTDVKENEDITDKYPEEPKRDGYSFDGWNEPETDSEGNVTITAKWKEDNSDDNNNGGNNGGNNNRPTGGGGNSNRPGRTPAGTGITNGGGLTEILDENVPLADVPDLNNTDHFAYIIGYEDGLVRPENNISRAEVATIFFRLMTDAYRSENWATSNNYSDVNVGQWFNNAVSTGTTAGILTGYEDGTFLPEQMITRAEFATMAVRFLSGDAAPIVSFNDIDGHWAADNILKAAAVGWINGYEDGSFRPDQPITRAETATLVNRMLNRDPKGGMLDDMVKWPDNPEDAWYYSAIQEATNGHDYVTGAEGETWTSMLANRDWSELEK